MSEPDHDHINDLLILLFPSLSLSLSQYNEEEDGEYVQGVSEMDEMEENGPSENSMPGLETSVASDGEDSDVGGWMGWREGFLDHPSLPPN